MKLKELGDWLGKNRQCFGRPERGLLGYCYDPGCPGKGRLVLRMRRNDGELFWGCSSFPDCTHSEPFIPFIDLTRRLK